MAGELAVDVDLALLRDGTEEQHGGRIGDGGEVHLAAVDDGAGLLLAAAAPAAASSATGEVDPLPGGIVKRLGYLGSIGRILDGPHPPIDELLGDDRLEVLVGSWLAGCPLPTPMILPGPFRSN